MDKNVKELTKQQQILLSACKYSITGKPFDIPYTDFIKADLKTLIKESIYQGVPLVFFSVSETLKNSLSFDDFNYWLNAIAPYLLANEKNLEVQKELVSLLKKEGYPYVILKGTSVAVDYFKPSLRALGDVDFLVKEDHTESVKKLLVNNGYHFKSDINDNHISFTKNGQVLELHFTPVHIPKGNVGKIIDKALKGWLKPFDSYEYEDCSFITYDKFRQGVVLLIHMGHHMTSFGIGLRHLCDWASYIKNVDKETEKDLVEFFNKTGLITYAKVMTKTCANYLGIDLPTWAKDIDDSLCYEVIEDIFKGGNFGAKDKVRADSGVLIVNQSGKSKSGGTKTLISKLHHSVMKRYPFLKYLFILYPFFFAYRLIRYGVLVLFGKRRKVSELSTLANERVSLYNKLKIYDVGDTNED